jgi:hypothetical protein
MRLPVFLVAALLAAPLALGQQVPLNVAFEAPGTHAYDPAIPTPEEVIGHVIGERHTRPDQVVSYFEAVAAASDRVTLRDHGTTYEGRRLIHAIVTDPSRDLEAARLANLRLSEDPAGVGDGALSQMPAIAYMGYSVHGDEASGTEAGLLLLYHLAAGQGPAVDRVLQDAVVIIDPMLNPDGRARFVDWVNANRGGSAEFASLDGQDREHNQPWPRGRTNHYLFDLNRDWLPMQHPETQGRMAMWHDWRPQLSTDFHEMGGNATYFFQPGIPSRNNPRTPELNYELTARLATYHAAALDRLGALYYTREDFDDYYFGKGSTYPDVQGSVGILFEQASSRAIAAETVHGRLDYGTTVRNQFATSLSSLEGAVEMRMDLLRFMRDFYAEAPQFASRAATRAYVVDASRDVQLGNDFIEMLRRSRIRAFEPAQSLTVDGHTYERGSSFVVPVDQQQAQLVKAVMERVLEFPDSLFYDVSTWSLPLAFGLPHAEMARQPGLGPELDALPVQGRLVGGQAAYAYVLPWGTAAAPRALYRFQQAGARARVMRQAFEAQGPGWRRTFAPGAVVIPVDLAADREALHAAARRAAADGLELFALETGLSPAGPDLGSSGARVLEMPRVALLAGEGTFPNAVGEVWYLLNERAGMPVSLLDLDRLDTADLGRYTSIVVTSRPRQPSDRAMDRLRQWVRDGGVLIASGAAAGWAASQDLGELSPRAAERDSTHHAWADVSAARGAQVIGGSAFEVALDTTHPLAFGYEGRLPVFKQGAQAFDLSAAPGTNVAVYTESPLLSGYASTENLARIAGGAAMVAQRQGRGAVVLFDFNPAFRAFWRGTEGLLLNAVFFGGAF